MPGNCLLGTSITSLWEHLSSLTVAQSYEDCKNHLFDRFPSFISKIRRVVDLNRRDGGLKVIGRSYTNAGTSAENAFKDVTDEFLEDSLEEKSDILFEREKEQMKKLEHLAIHPSENCSKNTNGYNFNKDLAKVITPALKKWATEQRSVHRELELQLQATRDRVMKEILTELDKTPTDLRSVEEAKKLWKDKALALELPISTLFKKMNKLAGDTATLVIYELSHESFIAKQTRPIFEKVYNTKPSRKEMITKKRRTEKGKTKPQYIYEQPVGEFQKALLLKLFADGIGGGGDIFTKIIDAL
ncbi:hypothetical protein BCR34DRAFT_598685 [Clohesyomyces aquaticus]|uniref:Uncharacterized protein n=1 Tax=Clohesyomyces aquaticus TaxID=1231657 RepID=A0A1Y1ZY88_9PLEO|nr:hypothetical protein BCR34DRAFT_598685 [Clohesyomyces aquaticus]